MIHKRFFIAAALLMLIVSCTSNPLDVDASHIEVDLKYVDLDSVIFYSDSADLLQKHRAFKSELGELYQYYQGYVMQFGELADTVFYNRIRIFRADTGIILLEKEIREKFPDISAIERELTDGFRHLKYHLPKEKMPETIVFMNSLFNSNVWCSEKEIGIGMDRYLGPEAETVKRLPPAYYDWVRKAMEKQYLTVDVQTSWIETNITGDSGGNLAEQMVRWGKILYLVQAAYPDMPEHQILRYNEDQLKWAKENEFAFWEYLVNEKMLFEENERNIANFLNPGPTTSGLPKEGSPDRLGRFIGWRMVKCYLDKNRITPAELLKLNYNTILQNYEIE